MTVLDSQLAEKETEALRSQRDEQLTTERERHFHLRPRAVHFTHTRVCVCVCMWGVLFLSLEVRKT